MFAGAHGAVDSLVIFAGDAGGGGDGRPGELTMLQVRHHPRVKIPGVGPYWKYIFQSVVQLNQQVLLSWPAPDWGLAGTLVASLVATSNFSCSSCDQFILFTVHLSH